MKTNTVYKCPLCGSDLKISIGNSFHPNNADFGLTLYCDNIATCEAEVFGHTMGTKRADAYETIMEKYKH